MKRNLVASFLLTLFSLATCQVRAQNAFYDARKLRDSAFVGKRVISGTNILMLPDMEIVYRVLKNYVPDSIKHKDDLVNYFQGNPYIQFNTGAAITHSELGAGINSGLSSIGGLDVTSVADGLARFIVARTKAELNMAFFGKFQELLAKPEYKDLQTVFPQTYSALNVIGDQIYNYNTYLQSLRDAFINDLGALSAHLPSVIDNHPAFFDRYPSMAALLQSGCYIASGIDDKVHPGDILNDYPSEYLDPLNPNWKASIKTAQIISRSLRDTASSPDSSYWVSVQRIRTFVKDDISFRIFMGLIYQQARNEAVVFRHHSTDVTLTSILDTPGQNILDLKRYVTNFGERAARLSRMIQAYRKMPNDSLKTEQYAAYFDASVDMLAYASHVSDLMPRKWANLPEKKFLFHLKDTLKEYFEVANCASRLVLAINRKNYASAIMNAVSMYDIIYARMATLELTMSGVGKIKRKEYDEAVNTIKQTGGLPLLASVEARQARIADAPDDNTRQAIRKVYDAQMVNEAGKGREMMQYMLKYGTFMSAVADAKTSDEVTDAIEAFALPPGSSRVKRETSFNVSLNAYAGLYYGYEKIQGVVADRSFTSLNQFNSYGLTAPIGIAVSKGKFSNFLVPSGHGHWSHSLFVSVVDLGAVAAFRFQASNDSVKQIPSIQLKDIFSPGVFWSVGIPKCPLSINVGVQLGPNLRKVESKVNDYSNNLYWRYSFSLCVDLPVLNLYSKN